MTGLSILIPAHNEASEIADCLAAVFASDPVPQIIRKEVLVLANGCRDRTGDIARSVPVPDGWQLRVMDIPQGGKLHALNIGDQTAQGDILVYLDAAVRISPGLLPRLVATLDQDAPRYASGRPEVFSDTSGFSRAYGRLWAQLPFVTDGVPGFGLFAMNRAGRARWQNWPQIIADDTFARLMFHPDERLLADAAYRWPLVHGFRNLVRVRRRQNAGVQEIETNFPELLRNDDKFTPSRGFVLGLLLRDPIGFLAYSAVTLAVKTPLFRSQARWARGR